MLEPWAEIIINVVYCIGSLLSIATMIRTSIRIYKRKKKIELERQRKERESKGTATGDKQHKKLAGKVRLKTFFRAYGLTLLIIIISVILVLFLNIVGKVNSSDPTATPTPTPTTTTPIILTVPTKRTVSDAWLDELEPIEPREKAFVWHIWNTFDPVQVKKSTFQHSIGVCIPDDELKGLNDVPLAEINHKEYIEYQLSYNYDTFQFDYGIDDLSFPDGIETACKCEYKIVVQSCNAKEYLGEDDNILYDSDWINYRSVLNRSTPMDVSKCESIRITVYWKFNMRQNGPSAFNIAIVNPILRVEKADTLVSQPPIKTTKPDSIR